MTELIKQRLVGILIMVVAGVVFIPDLLDGKKQLTKEEFRKIPAKPELQEQPIITDFPKEQVLAALKKAPTLSQEQALDDIAVATTQSNPETESADMSLEQKQESNVTKVAVNNTEVKTQVTPTAGKVIEQSKVNFEKKLWVLRLGSFRNKPNVDALISKLEEAGVETFVKPVEAKAGLLYRVFVGPEENKNDLKKAQQTLKELTGLNGKITKFDPIN